VVAKKIIAAGPGYLSPTYNKLGITMSDGGLAEMEGLIKDLKETCMSTRCNIIMNGWIFTPRLKYIRNNNVRQRGLKGAMVNGRP
jgi:hypothetical protein